MSARIREIRPVSIGAGRCECCEVRPATTTYDGGRVCGTCRDFLDQHDTTPPARTAGRP